MEVTTSPSVPFSTFSVQTTDRALKFAIFLLRGLSFLSFMVFILCLPLGDPKDTCTEEFCRQNSKTSTVAVSYVCNVYKVFASTVKFTSNTMQDVSERTGCFILDVLHGAKLKFYNLLSIVDKQDLCRTVCCQEDSDLDIEPTPQQRETRKTCKCKAKCCKRKQQAQAT